MYMIRTTAHYNLHNLRKSGLRAFFESFNLHFSRAMAMETEDSGVNWRGVPLSEIIGSQSPWGAPEFPLVSPSHNHAVLYHIPSSGNTSDRPLKPQVGSDKWDGDHVRMPCSSKSLYPVEDSAGETHLKKRWEMIEDALRKPINNSKELAETILSYNTKFRNTWKFKALHSLFDDHLDEEETKYFFTVTLPEIAKLALDLPKQIQAPIPMLKQHHSKSISLTQRQVACLLANAFFCTFPRRNTTKRASEYASYPHINFSSLYETQPYDDILEKLKCLCHYFRRVCTKAGQGVVTFSRRSVNERSCPLWSQSNRPIATLPIHVDPEGKIEDAHGLIQLDFANKYLGGGVLGHGCVQEEIRFAICPELMLSMLFTEMLKPHEALIMIGCERYSLYEGYGHSFRWSGDYKDQTPFDSSGRRRVAVLAVDALPYYDGVNEFKKEMFHRELNKAWIGFSFYSTGDSLQYPGIATGNWGCGAFGGTPQLKSLIQIMACAQAKRPMAYYTFGDVDLRDEIVNVYNLLSRYNVTVGQLYQYICRFSSTDVKRTQLHSYLQQIILDDNKLLSERKEPELHNMSTSPEKEQRKQLNNSPDLFSQEDGQSSNENESQTALEGRLNKMPKTSHENDLADLENKMDDLENKMANSENKMADSNKMDVHTMTLIEELNKSEEDGSKCESGITSNLVPLENKTKDGSTKSSVSKIDVSAGEKCARRSLFDEMQKFDEEQGMLNLLSPHPMPLKETRITIPECDASIDTDMAMADASPEVKKKIAKKITDYFGKKST